MHIDIAIKNNEAYLRNPLCNLMPPERDALQLGIEALKRCKERSDRFPNLPHLRLPGETKD